MNLIGGIWRKRSALASVAGASALVVTISTLAVLYQGVSTADVKLDDGGVWVTKSTDARVGHLNYPSRLLDGSLLARSSSFDVVQSGESVIVHDSGSGTLSVVDTAGVKLGADTAVTPAASVALGGTTVAVDDGGAVHVLPISGLNGVTFSADDAQLKAGTGSTVAVASDGSSVGVISTADESIHLLDSTGAELSSRRLDTLAKDAQLQLAMIGAVPVAFDAKNGVVYLPNGSTTLSDAIGGQLQQSAAVDSSVYISAKQGLYRVPLDGSAPVKVASVTSGTPAEPVRLSGCTYGVWSGSAQYARWCDGDSDASVQTVTGAAAASTLVLRTNRRVVVVNDTSLGSVWLVDQNMQKVDNWADVTPPVDQNADQEQSEAQTQQNVIPPRSAQNHPPTAVDDHFGARAGRTTILRVTDNDTDPDGDLLSASLVGTAPEGWTITPVLGGAALQASIPATATGSVTFRYMVNDGHPGGTSEANVRVDIHDASVNAPPQQDKTKTIQVESGATVTYDALNGWSDPDGDDFYLERASVEGGDTVTFRSNGVLQFTAASGVAGLKKVTLVVSDGRAETTGTLMVDVRPAGTLDPVANADRVTTVVGTAVVVSPLTNDISGSGQPLRLAKLDFPAGASLTPDYNAGTFQFVSQVAGTYYVQYLVTDGPRSALGLVRVDVLVASTDPPPPVAVRDLALLPAGRSTLVDVLANDSDPSGGVLVVQSVGIPTGAPISVEVLQHAVLRVTDLGVTAPVTFSYTVSNGAQSAEGQVVVMPVPLPAKLRPPVTQDDSVTVRAGDIATVSVMSNDYSPDDDTLTLVHDLVGTDLPDRSAAFVDGNTVRVQAPGAAGTYHVTYEVEDSQHQKAAGYLTIHVLAADAANNSAPRPLPVVARVMAGTSVRIPIPLDGIDPDGDSVQLVGVASNPALGRVTVGDTWLTYVAYPTAFGRDTFTYVVRDRLGAQAQATVTVGVATVGAQNQPPYAAKDTVTVKPGRKLAIAVLANDSDPDGDEISIDPNGLTVPPGVTDAAVTDGRVTLTAPQDAGDYTFTYTISDTYGAQAKGVLVVTVDPNAPAQAPIARDDYVAPDQIGSSATVDLPVLTNDEDPDGSAADLKVSVPGGDATVSASGTLTVAVADAPQIIRYEVTDLDGLTAQAFVHVPGRADLVPALNLAEPLKVQSGATLAIDLHQIVKVRDGHQVRVSTADSVVASHANGGQLLQDDHTLSYTSAANYFGPDTVGVLVTDGSGPDDPTGLSAFITIPIQVLPAQNQPPTLRGASVTVAPAEDAVKLDLSRLAYDPDDGDQLRLAYALSGSVPADLTASVQGAQLTVSAASGAAVGTSETLTVTVTDGKSGPVSASVAVRIVASQRPLPVANDDTVAQAQAGQTVSVDVLANDYNPFPERGPLTLLSARALTASQGTVAVNGSKVDVTPAPGFVGSMIVAYRIGDATGSPDRQVEGRITLVVRAVPDAPGTPVVASIQDSTVVLSWAAPSNNGAPITQYRVSSQNGYSKTCASTTCTLDGLQNNVEYTFRVVATNEVGDSAPSPQSAVARPDARPDVPSAPALIFGDKSLNVSWQTPRSTGSPVLSYNLEISPAPASGPVQLTGVTGNSLVWSGLENGVGYQVRVQAVNRAPEPSDWSAYSVTTVPAAVPDAPSQPTASFAPSVGAQAQIAVSWQPPAKSNGDAVQSYTVTSHGGDGVTRTQVATTTTATFSVGTSQNGYTFTVTAKNKAGDSPSSPTSASVQAANAPDAPATVTVVATGTAGQLRATITPGAWNGNKPSDVTWLWSGTGSGTLAIESQTTSSVVGLINGAANGQAQQVQVWGRSNVTGSDGAKTTSSNQAKPWGPLQGYTPSSTQNGDKVCFTWDVSGALNGQTLTSVSYSADAGDTGTNGSATGSACSGSGYYANRNVTVTVNTAEGNSRTYTASGSTGDNPATSVVLEKANGAAGNLKFTISNARPNTTYHVAIYSDCASGRTGCTPSYDEVPSVESDVTTDGSGNWTGVTAKYYQYSDNLQAVLRLGGADKAKSSWVKF